VQPEKTTRRHFIKGASAIAAASILPSTARATSIKNRLEWNDFKMSTAYPGYLKAIGAMRANTKSSDRRSWAYWVNIHISNCPHGAPYFLAWHRGYLHHFQQVLRELSGNSSLMIPYWDYYKNPVMPPEFTDSASANPLYVEGRLNTNVYPSLSLSPFLIKYKNFQRGVVDAFEPVIETAPHGMLHNIVGGVMTGMSSPGDPIFWLHHGQIDRLWLAWVTANAGRQMPPLADAYWTGLHTYATTLSMARAMTHDTHSLFYTYADKALPTSLPPLARAAQLRMVASPSPGSQALRRPPPGRFEPSAPRPIGSNNRSIGGVKSVALDENSVTAQITPEITDSKLLQSIAESRTAAADADRAPSPYRYANLVLDRPSVTGAGSEGGYFYDIYLNLPTSSGGDVDQLLVGRFGPFEIAAHAQHGAQHGRSGLAFALTPVLVALGQDGLRDLTVSFIRRSGANSPRGTVVTVEEVRVELSNESAG
jgi:tyrosinase